MRKASLSVGFDKGESSLGSTRTLPVFNARKVEPVLEEFISFPVVEITPERALVESATRIVGSSDVVGCGARVIAV
jgi:hypothetical protein